MTRDELIDVLWPSGPPTNPEDVLGALLSKLRRVLGAGALEGRRELMLVLPAGASIDLEVAEGTIRDAEAALGARDARLAFDRAQASSGVLAGEFLPGHDGLWAQERRLAVEELRLRRLESVARAGLVLAGGQLAIAEAAARELISAEPLRERGYRVLMEVSWSDSARRSSARWMAVWSRCSAQWFHTRMTPRARYGRRSGCARSGL